MILCLVTLLELVRYGRKLVVDAEHHEHELEDDPNEDKCRDTEQETRLNPEKIERQGDDFVLGRLHDDGEYCHLRDEMEYPREIPEIEPLEGKEKTERLERRLHDEDGDILHEEDEESHRFGESHIGRGESGNIRILGRFLLHKK